MLYEARFPAPGYGIDEDSFAYTIGDGQGGSASSIVTVVVRNEPPVAGADVVQLEAVTTTLEIPVTTLLGNDSDPDSDPLTLSAVSPQSDQGGRVTLANNLVTYVLPRSVQEYVVGTDTFTYTIDDGRNGSASGTVTVQLPNHPPFADDDNADE